MTSHEVIDWMNSKYRSVDFLFQPIRLVEKQSQEARATLADVSCTKRNAALWMPLVFCSNPNPTQQPCLPPIQTSFSETNR